jgi:hypothetical protein
MNPKLKNVEMHKLFCLTSLLLESLDTLKPTTPKMIKYRDDLIGLCEEMNKNVEDTYTIQKGTYFQDICNKINTVLRKNFNQNM